MDKLFGGTLLCLAGSIGPVMAASVDDYVEACIKNQGNAMGPELCRCVGNDTLDQFGAAGVDYMYYNASKQSTKMHAAMARMSQQQKMGIMMFTMQAPSACAGKLARSKQNPPAQNNAGSGSVSGEAAASASDTAGEAAN